MSTPETPAAGLGAAGRSGGKSYRGLIGLNIALLAALGAVSFAPGAGAQSGAERSRGAYAAVSGNIQGSASDAIFVIDRNNQEMLGMVFDQSRKQLTGIDFVDLSDRARGGGGR
jgi:hypothetical protein